MKTVLASVGLLLVVLLAGLLAFVYSGYYNTSADDPHLDVTSRMLETLRERSIERRAREVQVPKLEDRQMVRRGAGLYAAMCESCHLAPGVQPTELSKGLYPAPPQLARRSPPDPAEAYVAIRHGIKMTGMPAWGGHHGDEHVWSLVAFLARLPGLSPQQYQEASRSPEARAAAAAAGHGAAMHGPPGHHDKPAPPAGAKQDR